MQALEVPGKDAGVGRDLGGEPAPLFRLPAGEEDAGEADLGLDHRPPLQQLAQHGLGLVRAAGLVQAAGEVEGPLADAGVRLDGHQLLEKRHGLGPAPLHLQRLGEAEVDVLDGAAALLRLPQQLLGFLGLAESHHLLARLGQGAGPPPMDELGLEHAQAAPRLEPPRRPRRHPGGVARPEHRAAHHHEVGDRADDGKGQDDHVPVPVGAYPDGVDQRPDGEDDGEEAQTAEPQAQEGKHGVHGRLQKDGLDGPIVSPRSRSARIALN